MKSFATKMVRMGWEREEALPEIASIDRCSIDESGRRYDVASRISKARRASGIARGVVAEQARKDAVESRNGQGWMFNLALAERYKTYKKVFWTEYLK